MTQQYSKSGKIVQQFLYGVKRNVVFEENCTISNSKLNFFSFRFWNTVWTTLLLPCNITQPLYYYLLTGKSSTLRGYGWSQPFRVTLLLFAGLNLEFESKIQVSLNSRFLRFKILICNFILKLNYLHTQFTFSKFTQKC